MKVTRTLIPEVLLFEPEVLGDSRGYFFESFREDFFQQWVPGTVFVQENESFSQYGVLRGLHYQRSPHAQGKLVRVVAGEVLDVAVDLRRGSPWFGQHVAYRLSADNKRQLWIPRGFAHGFAVLSPTAQFTYKCDNYYEPTADAGISFEDPALGIDWLLPTQEMLLSSKDRKHPLLAQVSDFDYADTCYSKIYGIVR